jgi:1-acyl-sn-glycerol-3-phosphate acyltransferase
LRVLSINHYWRIAASGLSFIVFGLGASLPGLYILVLSITPMQAEVKQRKVRDTISGLCRFYVNFMQFLGLFNFQLNKQENQTSEGQLLIANHSMLIDALFILAYTDNLCCVVKSALCRNPVTRIPVKLAGYIANDDEKMIEYASAKLKKGENVLIFPEGTRAKDDMQLDFKRGAANIAIISGVSILPVVIACRPRVLRKGDKWYEMPESKPQIVINFNRSLVLADCIDRDLPRTVQYRRLTKWLHDYYTDEVGKLVGLLA